ERRSELRAGHQLSSETDTETLPHLIETYMRDGDDLVAALRRTLARIKGAHAIVAMSKREPGRIVAARAGNAGGVVVGYGNHEMFVASDLPALLAETQRVAFLADGEMASITPAGVEHLTFAGEQRDRRAEG